MGRLAVHSGIKNQISATYESFTLAIQQENAVELWGIILCITEDEINNFFLNCNYPIKPCSAL